MVECTLSAMDRWKDISGNEKPFELDISNELSLLALEIIGRSAFGAKIAGGSETAREISQNLTIYLETVITTIVGGYRLIPGYRWVVKAHFLLIVSENLEKVRISSLFPTPLNRKIAYTSGKIQKKMLELIRNRREAQGKVRGSDPKS